MDSSLEDRREKGEMSQRSVMGDISPPNHFFVSIAGFSPRVIVMLRPPLLSGAGSALRVAIIESTPSGDLQEAKALKHGKKRISKNSPRALQ